jgi:predicted transposase/invertase (TIGR01784 family)
MDSKKKKKAPKTAHDIFAKKILSYKKNAVTFFSGILPEPLQADLKLRTVKLDTSSYTDKKLDQYFSDVVYNCSYRSGRSMAKLALLFEHKSFIPKFPYSQLLRYILNIWDSHTKQKKPRPVVLPILFYHGRRKWKQRPLYSYLSGNTELYRQFIPGFEYVLVNLREYDEETITELFQKNPAVKLWLFIQKYVFTPKRVLHTLRNLTDVDRMFLTTEEGLNVLETICRYLFKATSLSAEEIIDAANTLPPNAKEAIMTTAEKLMKQGEERGLEKGVLAKAREDAQRMLDEGLDIELIIRVTGLSREEVEGLRRG